MIENSVWDFNLVGAINVTCDNNLLKIALILSRLNAFTCKLITEEEWIRK